ANPRHRHSGETGAPDVRRSDAPSDARVAIQTADRRRDSARSHSRVDGAVSHRAARAAGQADGVAMRSCASLVALALFATSALGQGKLVESVEVRVVNVDVVVTDRDGNRIDGLTKDDFELI